MDYRNREEIDLPERRTNGGVAWILGFAADDHIRAYCELSGRRARFVEDVAAIGLSGDDTVILHDSALTADTLWRLCLDTEAQTVPGLIPIGTTADLAAIARRITPTPTADRPAIRQRTFIYSRAPFGKIVRQDDLLLGSQAPGADLKAALAVPSATLTVVGHSDGLDLALSDKHYACGFIGGRGEGLAPQCQVEDRCTRYPVGPTIGEAAAKDWILPTEDFRAEVGVILGCNVVRIVDGIVDPSHSFGVRLFRTSQMRAVITTWRFEQFKRDGGVANALVNQLSAGVPVGRAVAAFNRVYGRGTEGIMLVLLGDPNLMLNTGGDLAVLPERTPPGPPKPALDETSPGDPNTDTDHIANEVPFLEAIVDLAPEVSSRLGRIGAAELKTALGEVTALPQGAAPPRALIDRLDRGLVTFFTPDARIWLVFEKFAHSRKFLGVEPCQGCLGPARAYKYYFSDSKKYARRTAICAGCRASLYAPDAYDIALDRSLISQGRLSISGLPKGAAGTFALVSASRALDKAVFHTVDFTAPQDGGGAIFDFPADMPTEPVFFCVIFSRNALVGTLITKVRKLADGRLVIADTQAAAVAA